MIRDEVRMQGADPYTIECRDCIYRDRDTMKLDGKTIQTGIMRGTCLIFDGKRGNWKPTAVVMRNEPCPFYELDEEAERFWEG